MAISSAQHSDAAEIFWNDLYGRVGRRAIASRTRAANYWTSGEEDFALIMSLADRVAPAPRTLEIGCGDGRVAAAACRSASTFVGQDIASAIIAGCPIHRSYVHRFLHGGPSVLAGLPDRSFDLIYSCYVFQHATTQHVAAYVGHAVRLLAVDGVAVLQFRHRSAYVRLHQALTDAGRIPTRMPSFRRFWRGCIMDPSAAEALVGDKDITCRIAHGSRIHYWMVLRRPAVGGARE